MMNVSRWVGGWALVWVVLAIGLVAWWWPTWAWVCDDCVPTGNPDDYGLSRSVIFWEPTLLFAGVVAALLVLVAAFAVSRIFPTRRPSSLG